MPIANCFINSERYDGDLNAIGDLVALWSKRTGESAQHMSLNFMLTDLQQGSRYVVMAWLYLPSLWSSVGATRLQIELAQALAEGLEIDLNEVHVVTTMIKSGFVVDDGKQVEW